MPRFALMSRNAELPNEINKCNGELSRAQALAVRRGAGAVATRIAAHPRSFAEVRVLVEPQPFARSLLHAHGIRALRRSIFSASLSVSN